MKSYKQFCNRRVSKHFFTKNTIISLASASTYMCTMATLIQELRNEEQLAIYGGFREWMKESGWQTTRVPWYVLESNSTIYHWYCLARPS